MTGLKSKIFENPIYQAIGGLVLVLIGDLVIGSGSDSISRQENLWIWGMTATLFTILFNVVLAFTNNDIKTYWIRSLLSITILTLIVLLLSWVLTGVSIFETPYAIIYITFLVSFFILFSIVATIRVLIQIVDERDEKFNNS